MSTSNEFSSQSKKIESNDADDDETIVGTQVAELRCSSIEATCCCRESLSIHVRKRSENRVLEGEPQRVQPFAGLLHSPCGEKSKVGQISASERTRADQHPHGEERQRPLRAKKLLYVHEANNYRSRAQGRGVLRRWQAGRQRDVYFEHKYIKNELY